MAGQEHSRARIARTEGTRQAMPKPCATLAARVAAIPSPSSYLQREPALPWYAIMPCVPLTPDELLTTTRSVRKRLDLTRPVPLDLVKQCLEIALQAPNGGMREGWHWIVGGTRPSRCVRSCRGSA